LYKEELIASVLDPDTYMLQVRPAGSAATHQTVGGDCESILLELSVSPKQRTIDRYLHQSLSGGISVHLNSILIRQNSFTDCPIGQLMPAQFDFSPLEIGMPFKFDSTSQTDPNRNKYNIRSDYSGNSFSKVHWSIIFYSHSRVIYILLEMGEVV